MRHRNAGYKLGRNTSHRRALLRNLVTSILLEDRVETTITKAKAARPHVEKLITLGKKGDLHSPPPGAVVSADAAKRSLGCLTRWRRAMAIARAATCASCAPASRRAMERRRLSSSCWAPSRFSTRSARSAPKLAPSAAKRCRRRWPSRASRRRRRAAELAVLFRITNAPPVPREVRFLFVARVCGATGRRHRNGRVSR